MFLPRLGIMGVVHLETNMLGHGVRRAQTTGAISTPPTVTSLPYFTVQGIVMGISPDSPGCNENFPSALF